MNIGAILTDLRKSKNLSRQNLADKLGISVHTYIKYENESVKPPYETLIKLADFYGVSTDYLLGRYTDEEMDREKMESEALKDFESLPPKIRKILLETLKKMVDASKNPDA